MNGGKEPGVKGGGRTKGDWRDERKNLGLDYGSKEPGARVGEEPGARRGAEEPGAKG